MEKGGGVVCLRGRLKVIYIVVLAYSCLIIKEISSLKVCSVSNEACSAPQWVRRQHKEAGCDFSPSDWGFQYPCPAGVTHFLGTQRLEWFIKHAAVLKIKQTKNKYFPPSQGQFMMPFSWWREGTTRHRLLTWGVHLWGGCRSGGSLGDTPWHHSSVWTAWGSAAPHCPPALLLGHQYHAPSLSSSPASVMGCRAVDSDLINHGINVVLHSYF